MLRAALMCAVLLATLLAAEARGAPPGPATGPPPPELVALAKKMEGVQLSSERFSLRFVASACGRHPWQDTFAAILFPCMAWLCWTTPFTSSGTVGCMRWT